MTNVSGERPISGDAHVGRAEFAPALSKIKGAFASIFPGKTVDDLTIATKLSSDALDKTLNFTPPRQVWAMQQQKNWCFKIKLI